MLVDTPADAGTPQVSQCPFLQLIIFGLHLGHVACMAIGFKFNPLFMQLLHCADHAAILLLQIQREVIFRLVSLRLSMLKISFWLVSFWLNLVCYLTVFNEIRIDVTIKYSEVADKIQPEAHMLCDCKYCRCNVC